MDSLTHPFVLSPTTIRGKYLPFAIITFSVIVDLLNGIVQGLLDLDFSVGVMYRGLLLLLLLSFSLKKRSFINILFYWIFVLCAWGLLERHFSITHEIINFSKCIYIYVVLTFFMRYKSCINSLFLTNCVIGFGLIASTSIIFSYATGIGFSYADYRFSVKSFFAAGNDIGLALLICLIFSVKHYFEKRTLSSLVIAITISLACMLIGSRTGIVGSILIWVVFTVGIFFFKFKALKISILFKLLYLAFIVIAFFFALQFVIKIITMSDYMRNKFVIEVLIGGEARKSLIEAGNEVITNRRIVSNLIGQGSFSFKKHVNYEVNGTFADIREVEVDYIDLIGAYGLLGGVFVIVPLYFFFLAIKNFLKNFTIKDFSNLIAMTVFLGHSFYAGHALFSPTVSSVMCVVFYFIVINRRNKSVI